MLRRRWVRILLWISGVTVGVALLATAILYRLVSPGMAMVKRLTASTPEAGVPFHEWLATARRGGRGVPVRVYQPDGGFERTFVLIHGLHWGGYDESRLVPFARLLAGLGYAVVTPDIEDLKNYAIQPRAVDDIETACLWTLDESGVVKDGRIGILGICFSGGLGLSAACRPSLRDRLTCVFAFGGHGDLDTTIEYLVTGLLPDGKSLPPHPYGQVVLLRQYADKLVDAAELAPFREALLIYLHGDEAGAREKGKPLSPRANELLELCFKWKTKELGDLLAPLVRAVRSPDALSPARQPNPPPCTVYLLHGSVDNVVPPSESLRLGKWATRSRVLISDLVVHVELENKKEITFWQKWDLIRFWTELLRS